MNNLPVYTLIFSILDLLDLTEDVIAPATEGLYVHMRSNVFTNDCENFAVITEINIVTMKVTMKIK